jgi:hypothetical protein
MLLVMVRYAESEGLFGDDLDDERTEKARVKYQLLPGLIAYIAGGALGLLSPRIGVIIYLLIAIYLAIPIREVTRLYQKRA